MLIYELPSGVLHEIICSDALTKLDRAALRASCHGLRSYVDKNLENAQWAGAQSKAPRACLPAGINTVTIHTMGPINKQWLLDTLTHVTSLKTLHITASDGWEPMQLKEAKRNPKPVDPPGLLAALPELLSYARPNTAHTTPPNTAATAGQGTASTATAARSPSPVDCTSSNSNTSGCLTSLTIWGVGTAAVRRVRERDMRLMMSRFAGLPADSGHGLQTLALPSGLYMYKVFLQALSTQLIGLSSLYLNGVCWHMCSHYATHTLSQMKGLTLLSFRNSDDMMVSHIAPLYLITSLKCLDLSRVQFEPPEEVPPDPLQDGWAKGCALLDSESKRVVERILSDNGWERDQVVRPVEVLLKQLARCTSLTALSVREFPLPWVEPPDLHDSAMFAVCLKSLSGSLTTVDLSFDEDPDMTVMPDAVYDAVSSLTHLTRLVLDQDWLPMSRYGSEFMTALGTKVLPNLQHLSLRGLLLEDTTVTTPITHATKLTHLDLSYPHHHMEESDARGMLHSVIESVGRSLKVLRIKGWAVDMRTVCASCPHLTELDVSRVQDCVPEFDPYQSTLLQCDWSVFKDLTTLKCWHTLLTAEGLVKVLIGCPKLEVLEAGCCYIDMDQLARRLYPAAKPQCLDELLSEGKAPPAPVIHTSLLSLSIDQQKVMAREISAQAALALVNCLPNVRWVGMRDMEVSLVSWCIMGLGWDCLMSVNSANCGLTDAHLSLLSQGSITQDEIITIMGQASPHQFVTRYSKQFKSKSKSISHFRKTLWTILHTLLKSKLDPQSARQSGSQGSTPQASPVTSPIKESVSVGSKEGAGKSGGVRYTLFKRLMDVEVTDDRTQQGRLTRSGVDAVARAVTADRIAVREVRVYEPRPPRTGRHDDDSDHDDSENDYETDDDSDGDGGSSESSSESSSSDGGDGEPELFPLFGEDYDGGHDLMPPFPPGMWPPPDTEDMHSLPPGHLSGVVHLSMPGGLPGLTIPISSLLQGAAAASANPLLPVTMQPILPIAAPGGGRGLVIPVPVPMGLGGLGLGGAGRGTGRGAGGGGGRGGGRGAAAGGIGGGLGQPGSPARSEESLPALVASSPSHSGSDDGPASHDSMPPLEPSSGSDDETEKKQPAPQQRATTAQAAATQPAAAAATARTAAAGKAAAGAAKPAAAAKPARSDSMPSLVPSSPSARTNDSMPSLEPNSPTHTDKSDNDSVPGLVPSSPSGSDNSMPALSRATHAGAANRTTSATQRANTSTAGAKGSVPPLARSGSDAASQGGDEDGDGASSSAPSSMPALVQPGRPARAASQSLPDSPRSSQYGSADEGGPGDHTGEGVEPPQKAGASTAKAAIAAGGKKGSSAAAGPSGGRNGQPSGGAGSKRHRDAAMDLDDEIPPLVPSSGSHTEDDDDDGSDEWETEGSESIGDSDSEDDDSSSEWEEVQEGDDHSVDELIKEKVEAHRRPRVLDPTAMQGWLKQGLLVRNTMHQANDEDRSRSWLHRQTQKQSGEFIEFDYS